MTERARGNEYRTTTLCIDSYEKGVPVGRFYNPYLSEPEPFESLSEFLVKMERLLNDMNLPQSFSAIRTFAPSPVWEGVKPLGNDRLSGSLATFSLRILFRQNASWQGSVTWLEGKKEQSFRSVLELILLADTALRAKSEPSHEGF